MDVGDKNTDAILSDNRVITKLPVEIIEEPPKNKYRNILAICANILTIINSLSLSCRYINKYLVVPANHTKYYLVTCFINIASIFVGANLAGIYGYRSWAVFNACAIFLNYYHSNKN